MSPRRAGNHGKATGVCTGRGGAALPDGDEGNETVRPELVLLSRQGAWSLDERDRERLESRATVRYHALHRAPGPRRAAELLEGASVLAATNVALPSVDELLLDQLPDLRAVVLYATGHDLVDDALLRRRGVRLRVLPDYATQAVAEHALALLLAQSTRLHLAHDRSRRLAPEETSLRGIELAGRTLAVVGVGRIGRRLAAMARGVGMRVVGVDVDARARALARADGVVVQPLPQALAGADLVALCASHPFGGAPVLGPVELRVMRPGAFLVNVGRPALVDTPAAMAALRTGRLRGYAVDDVVADPVRDADVLGEGRLLQTGHSAWWRDEVLARGRRMWADAIHEALAGAVDDLVPAPREADATVVAGAGAP